MKAPARPKEWRPFEAILDLDSLLSRIEPDGAVICRSAIYRPRVVAILRDLGIDACPFRRAGRMILVNSFPNETMRALLGVLAERRGPQSKSIDAQKRLRTVAHWELDPYRKRAPYDRVGDR